MKASGRTRADMPRRSAFPLIYALALGAAVSAALVLPTGIGGIAQYGAWLYVGAITSIVTLAVDRFLHILFERWAPPEAFIVIPFLETALGVLAGLWANNSMGGPT